MQPLKLAQPALSLRELFPAYEVERLRGKSQGTSNQHYIAIGHLREHLEREPTTDDLVDGPITDFLWALIERRGIAIDTAVSYTKKILALWRFANEQHYVLKPPHVELPPIPERDPLAWTEPEVQILFRALCSQTGMIGPAPANLFWPSLVLTFWDSAERLGAVTMLRPEDVNLVSAWATCRAETRKGKLRDRGFPMHAQTVDFIKLLLGYGPRRKLVFEAPFGESTLRDRYKSILRDVGLPHDRRRLFHCLRKTVASHFEALHFDAQELLDHSTREVTKRYLSPQIVRPTHPADVLFRPTG